MQAKTTRAFRTISEAGDELGLQPHVLRFWESKFSDIKPIKRGGGRRFYRPEDIEFLRGIKILLHDEKHPIKDVQKLIRVKGSNSVIALGQSLQRASQDKKVKETVLIPERIQKAKPASRPIKFKPVEDEKVVPFTVVEEPEPEIETQSEAENILELSEVAPSDETEIDIPAQAPLNIHPAVDYEALGDALSRLTSLRSKWTDFKNPAS